jgi:kynureninase
MTAAQLDAQDELAHFRDRFVIDDPELIYLDGNSLGRMPKATLELLDRETREGWGKGLVRHWSRWFHLPQEIGAKIARVIGAEADEVIVSDSTTVNLFKLVTAILNRDPSRTDVVTDDLNFPSDVYAISSAVGTFGSTNVVISPDKQTVPDGDIAGALDERTALLTLSHTSFKSAFVYDMRGITALAGEHGVPVLWDLSHSVGSVPVDLGGSGAALAVGCSYKYLNGGPGAPAFLYARREFQDELDNPIWGWFGRQNAFAFDLDYEPKSGVDKFLVGTPPVLSLACIEPGVDLVLEAGMDRIRAKSILQTEFLISLWSERLAPLGVSLNSPRDPAKRGAHVSFGHPEALRIDKALIEEMNVVPDFRAPDNLRFGLSPLYTSFAEIEGAVVRFERVLRERTYERYDANPAEVT